MQNGYQIHDVTTAPAESLPMLEAITQANGFVPNCQAALAESPTALAGYIALDQQIGKSGFSDTEKNIIYLAVTRENACPYCVAAYTAVAGMGGMTDRSIDCIINGEALEDAQLETLRRFAAHMTVTRGEVTADEVQQMLDAGYTRAQLLEISLFIAINSIGAHANRLMGTDLDEMLLPEKWRRVA